MNTTPLETTEQQAFVLWLENQNLKFTAIPNSTYTKSWKQKAKNKADGVRAGFPDMVVIVPCGDGKKRLVCIEMKRQKGGTVSKLQKEWINALNECEEVGAYVCRGFDQAKDLIVNLTK